MPQSSAPGEENERLDALEATVRTLLQRMQSLEERVGAVESTPQGIVPPAPSPETSSKPSPIMIDVLKKGLFHQMWKYMNDEHHPDS